MVAFSFTTEDILLTNSHSIDGDTIEEYLGLVVADVTPGRNVVQDIAGGIRDVVGGRSRSWEGTLEENQRAALAELVEEARELGADAVIGLHLEDEVVGPQGGMINVKAAGTAVRLAH